jgi:D-alanine-D-alanine ligase
VTPKPARETRALPNQRAFTFKDNAMMRPANLPKKIAVLMGGPSSEREVSLATGRGISKALRSLGADVVDVDVRDTKFALPDDVDLAFIALHGTFGEDGQTQQILEKRGVGYTGEGVEESRLAFDKIRSKEKFREHGVSTPEWETIGAHQRPRMQLPVVVKAPRQGSTVGVHIVKKAEELEPAIADAAKYDRELLIEKFVPGRELTIGILGDQALPILEIIPKGGFYDFTNKYPFLNPQAGGAAQHICPARIEPERTKEIQELALRAFRALGLRVYSRVDVILSETGKPFVLEINTIPGMTEASLLPEAAGAAGISYVDLCARIIALSRTRTERNRK